jgi:hypothetical protein
MSCTSPIFNENKKEGGLEGLIYPSLKIINIFTLRIKLLLIGCMLNLLVLQGFNGFAQLKTFSLWSLVPKSYVIANSSLIHLQQLYDVL